MDDAIISNIITISAVVVGAVLTFVFTLLIDSMSEKKKNRDINDTIKTTLQLLKYDVSSLKSAIADDKLINHMGSIVHIIDFNRKIDEIGYYIKKMKGTPEKQEFIKHYDSFNDFSRGIDRIIKDYEDEEKRNMELNIFKSMLTDYLNAFNEKIQKGIEIIESIK